MAYSIVSFRLVFHVQMNSIIPPSALFRFRIPCLELPKLPKQIGDLSLDERYRLPAFSELDSNQPFADVRMAWTRTLLIWQVEVRGKKKKLWCREGRADESDGLHVWLDTRDTKTVQRATQFCHQFAFLPAGGGTLRDRTVAEQIWMAQAGGNPRAFDPGTMRVAAQVEPSAYKLVAALETCQLTGYDPAETTRFGFFYQVIDAEKGRQTLSLNPDLYRFADDPSLWATLDLVSA